MILCVLNADKKRSRTAVAAAGQRKYGGLRHSSFMYRGKRTPYTRFACPLYDNGPGLSSSECYVRSWSGEDARRLSEAWWHKYAHHFLSLSQEQRTTERVKALKEELIANNADF